MKKIKKEIKIAILGAGWFGCYIGHELVKENLNITIFEKQKDIFQNGSGNNQNRLHLGFHYPRSYLTRKMSREGYAEFIKKFPQFVKKIDKNIYAIAKDKKNLVTARTYEQTMNKSKVNFSKIDLKKTKLQNIVEAYNTNEKFIDQKTVISFFKKKLKKYIIFNKDIKKIKKIKNKYQIDNKLFDFVINCTWQQSFVVEYFNLTYEHCLVSLYKPKVKNHSSYTIMDGPYYTLYQWGKNIFSLYSVKDSRVLSSKNYNLVNESLKKISSKKKVIIRDKISDGFIKFYPLFKKNFTFIKNLNSIRTIVKNKKDARVCIVKNNDNFINILSGKIDHIFFAYREVLKCLKIY